MPPSPSPPFAEKRNTRVQNWSTNGEAKHAYIHAACAPSARGQQTHLGILFAEHVVPEQQLRVPLLEIPLHAGGADAHQQLLVVLLATKRTSVVAQRGSTSAVSAGSVWGGVCKTANRSPPFEAWRGRKTAETRSLHLGKDVVWVTTTSAREGTEIDAQRPNPARFRASNNRFTFEKQRLKKKTHL